MKRLDNMMLNQEQIKSIYEAGIEQGCRVALDGFNRFIQFDELVDALYDIINDRRSYGTEGYMTADEILESLKEKEEV